MVMLITLWIYTQSRKMKCRAVIANGMNMTVVKLYLVNKAAVCIAAYVGTG